MKILVFELAFRICYCIVLYVLIFSLSYLNQAKLLEYFAGLFVSYYQTIEFDFYDNLLCNSILGGTPRLPHNNYEYHFINYASQNEAKSWALVFLNNLNYFYCLQLKPIYLNFIINYNIISYNFVYNLIQVYAFFLPGLLNYQKLYAWFVMHNLVYILMLLQYNSHMVFFLLFTLNQELYLEPIDSELQTIIKNFN